MLELLITIYLSLFSILILPIVVFSLEIFLGVFFPPKKSEKLLTGAMPRTVVIVPAHNEAEVIADTLISLMNQAESIEKVIVVADNCDDETSDISKRLGATVYERNNSSERGKGYALAFGIEKAKSFEPEVIIVVDADCIVSDGTIDVLAKAAHTTKQVYQSNYLIKAHRASPVSSRVSELAILVKNYVRMQGLSQLGASVHLTGTGMAFPYNVISKFELASGEIVEDMKLGIDIALSGNRVCFLPECSVCSELPMTKNTRNKQRERWEHGHLNLIQKRALPLLFSSISKLQVSLFILFLDLIIPPLSLLILLVLFFGAFGVIMAFLTVNLIYIILPLVMLATILLSLSVAWFKFGRNIISAKELVQFPSYVFGKAGSYLKFTRNRERNWIKTKRD